MCDTWVALSDVTLSQNVIFGKNSDRPIFDCQPLVFSPRKAWPANSHIQTEYIELPQADVTYAHLGSCPYWCWGYEEGINEYGVVIGNEAIFTKTFRDAAEALNKGRQPELGLLGMDLIRLALERSQTARQAVELMGELIEHFGFATLVSVDNGEPSVTHLPLLLDRTASEHGMLLGHMARANNQWRGFERGGEALVIFQAEHGYVSPSWYETDPSVPT